MATRATYVTRPVKIKLRGNAGEQEGYFMFMDNTDDFSERGHPMPEFFFIPKNSAGAVMPLISGVWKWCIIYKNGYL